MNRWNAWSCASNKRTNTLSKYSIKMRPPSKGWYTHDEQIRAELDNLRKALNEARSRGMSDVVNNKYPNINKVSELQPPKSTDAKVPKICQ